MLTKVTKSELKTARRPEKDGMQRILAAAIHEFCLTGLAGTKLDVIALEAGVSKQLIHHYFRTKEELYIAVINEVSSKTIETLENIDYENLDPKVAVQLLLETSFDFFVDWPFLAGLYNDQGLYGGGHMPECRDFIMGSPRLLARLKQVLARGIASGDFREGVDSEETIAVAIMAVIGCFINSPILSSLIPTDLSLSKNIENWRKFSVDFVLNSLRK